MGPITLIIGEVTSQEGVDLTAGVAVREETDEATGMTQKIVADWRTAPKGNELAPKIIIAGPDGEPMKRRRQPAGLCHVG